MTHKKLGLAMVIDATLNLCHALFPMKRFRLFGAFALCVGRLLRLPLPTRN